MTKSWDVIPAQRKMQNNPAKNFEDASSKPSQLKTNNCGGSSTKCLSHKDLVSMSYYLSYIPSLCLCVVVRPLSSSSYPLNPIQPAPKTNSGFAVIEDFINFKVSLAVSQFSGWNLLKSLDWMFLRVQWWNSAFTSSQTPIVPKSTARWSTGNPLQLVKLRDITRPGHIKVGLDQCLLPLFGLTNHIMAQSSKANNVIAAKFSSCSPLCCCQFTESTQPSSAPGQRPLLFTSAILFIQSPPPSPVSRLLCRTQRHRSLKIRWHYHGV